MSLPISVSGMKSRMSRQGRSREATEGESLSVANGEENAFTTREADSDQWFRSFCRVVVVVATMLYLVQLLTPLRLTTDAIDYLSLADAASRGGVVGLFTSNFRFPKGYPFFAFLLMRTGLFSSATLVAANLVFFAAGLAFSFKTLTQLGARRRHALLVCLLTLVSFTAVKHITQGMSDFLFFALSSCTCWLMTVRARFAWIAMLICAVCAMETRFIGLALAVPLVVIAWPLVRKRAAIALLPAVVGFGSLGIWAGRHYLAANLEFLRRHGLFSFIVGAVTFHSRDFGELLMNVPFAKLPAESRFVLLPIGAVAMLLFLAGAFALRRLSNWISAYLIAYSLLVLLWPSTDPRFWLPALPFVWLAIGSGVSLVLKDFGKPQVLAAYVVVFCALGVAALAYSTWVTFSGPKFPDRYGDGLLRTTYLQGCSPTSSSTNGPALNLLQRYGWHCHMEP